MMDFGTVLVLVGLTMMAVGVYRILKVSARYPRRYPMACMDCSIPYTTALIEGSTGLCEGCLSIRNAISEYRRSFDARNRAQLCS